MTLAVPDVKAPSTRPKPKYMAKRPLLTIRIPSYRSESESDLSTLNDQGRSHQEVSWFSPMTPTPSTASSSSFSVARFRDGLSSSLHQENKTSTPAPFGSLQPIVELLPLQQSRRISIQVNHQKPSSVMTTTRKFQPKLYHALFFSESPLPLPSATQHPQAYACCPVHRSNGLEDFQPHLRSTTCWNFLAITRRST